MRYLAIDCGLKRTGLAICDRAETLASPLAVIQGQKQLLEKIADIVTRENVDAIVLGLPLNMDGSRGAQAKKAQEFAEQLKHASKFRYFFRTKDSPHLAPKKNSLPLNIQEPAKKRGLMLSLLLKSYRLFSKRRTQNRKLSLHQHRLVNFCRNSAHHT